MINAKISLKHDNVHYITKNYVLKLIYNDENECIYDTLSIGSSILGASTLLNVLIQHLLLQSTF